MLLETCQTVRQITDLFDFQAGLSSPTMACFPVFIFCIVFIVCHELQWVKSHVTTVTTKKKCPLKRRHLLFDVWYSS